MLIRNSRSIEPSSTGNCTNFDESLCEPSTFLDMSLKNPEDDFKPDEETFNMETMLIDIDERSPNDLKDNVLYYIVGFIVRKILPNINCTDCRQELLLDPSDPRALKVVEFPVYSRFTQSLQRGGLTLPSLAVMKLSKGY